MYCEMKQFFKSDANSPEEQRRRDSTGEFHKKTYRRNIFVKSFKNIRGYVEKYCIIFLIIKSKDSIGRPGGVVVNLEIH